MPLLGRHKSPTSNPASPQPPSTGDRGMSQQAGATGRQQVCESPLFGLRRQLGRDKADSGGGIICESQGKRELGSVPQQITREQIHYAFSIMDTNKDGLIDLRDLSQMLSNLGVPIDEAILSHIMSSVSKRGDHRISEAEFVDWIAHFIQITETVSSPGLTGFPAAAASARATGKQASRSSRSTKVARSSTAASSLLAQTPGETQMQRSRRGSGSGLALMRSLSSSCASSSGSPPEPGSPLSLKASLSSPASAASSPPSSSSSSLIGQARIGQQQQQQQQRGKQLKREPSNDSEARDDLKAAFCVFDLDGDGYITHEEVRAGLKLLGETWSPAELRRLFSKCSNSQPNDLSPGGSGAHQQQQRISIDDFVHLLL